MVFDISALNSSVEEIFCDKSAIWSSQSGVVPIQVAITIAALYSDDGAYRIAGESITADCPFNSIVTMKRGDTLTFDTVVYNVLDIQRDGAGWATILLEKQ